MHRIGISPLLGPAIVFYLIADVAASHGPLDAYGYVLAAVAIALSFSRRGAAVEPGGPRAPRLVGWLGLAASIALLRLLSDPAQRLSVDLSESFALAMTGALLLDLALFVPERLGPKRLAIAGVVGGYAVAAVSGALSCLALGDPFWMFGQPWILPAHLVEAPVYFAGCAVSLALGLRALRRRLGGSQEVLVANLWGTLALVPAALLCAWLLAGHFVPSWFVQIWSALSALVLYGAHLCVIDSRRRLLLTRSTRDAIAVAIAVLVVAGSAGEVMIPDGALPRGMWVAGTLCVALALYLALRNAVRRALSPDRGRLLESLETTQVELAKAQTLESLVALALSGLRTASGDRWTRPLIYGLDPAFEGSIDAAGAPHLHSRRPPRALLARLLEYPGDLLVRTELEQQLVRQANVRPLVEVLTEHDVLCVVPLVIDAELEGALLLPRGRRRALLSSEEQAALWEFARQLAGLLSVFSAKSRAEQRANVASLESKQAKTEVERLSSDVRALRADVEVLQMARSAQAEAATLVAYSAALRGLLAQLKAFAHDNAPPVLLVAEVGCDVEPLARFIHAHAGRASTPFIVFDCAAVRAEHAAAALFGGEGPLGREVGCLRVAGSGTLLLLDVAALSLAVQHKLALALETQSAQLESQAADAGASSAGAVRYSVQAHVVASARDEVLELAKQGRFTSELAEQLSAGSCRVPPLRECREDVASLVLLAIDHACRRHGRGVMGIETEALAEMRNYSFPGNHRELALIIDRAVAGAHGLRLTLADLSIARLSTKTADDPLQGTMEEVERRALLHALSRAGGNKSEAARLLGLPRTTLLDKLRRHKLDEGSQDTRGLN